MKSTLDIIEEYGIELKPIGKEIYRGFCKIHDDSTAGKPQFTYYSSSDSWYCFRCGIGGDAIRLVAEMEHIPYGEAKKRLIGTEQEQLEEFKNTLEDLDIDIAQDYNLQLNFSLREKFRTLLYKYPEKAQDILGAMKALDEELKNKITFEKMNELFQRYKNFQDQIVAEFSRT